MSTDTVADIYEKPGVPYSTSVDAYSTTTIGAATPPVETAAVVNPPLGGGVPAPGPPVAGTTWNPADKGTGIVLSNGDLTATGVVSVRAAASASSGKKYYEVLWGGAAGGNQPYIGIANNAAGFLNTNRVGSAAASAAFQSGGFSYLNGVGPDFAGGIPTFTLGDVIGVAVDLTAGSIWYSKNGVWINNAASAVGNPSTGANPRSTGLTATTYYPAISPEATHNFTARFASSDFGYPVPTGFSPW